jgi:hypothetical protein
MAPVPSGLPLGEEEDEDEDDPDDPDDESDNGMSVPVV